ncbi:hypothetical protein GDO78_013413 [Eleutherodactylus coqui]|uniref:Uncharacterized protein n=1 Tax=Eleutherodactylus coqui TaxID=57060 RepID=A0A8J6F0J0_ELECQ|nr:hypothetical protein GDO78_013413 [Eleutherodactylus coqui]
MYDEGGVRLYPCGLAWSVPECLLYLGPCSSVLQAASDGIWYLFCFVGLIGTVNGVVSLLPYEIGLWWYRRASSTSLVVILQHTTQRLLWSFA